VLTILNISKEYIQDTSKRVLAIKNISFGVNEGEFVSIVGPSGCGKTTLLMCIAGLMSPSNGHVLLNKKKVEKPPKEMVLIFQNYTNSLFPWRTVLGNVMFALENKNIAKSKMVAIAEKSILDVGLGDFLRYYPWELSGGMQQRVAIARGLAYGSGIILMDEPFASVDAQTRVDLEDLILAVWKEYSKTILFVTHDIDEAVYLSERIFILSKRPSTVLETIPVNLEQPRDQLKTKGDKNFINLRNKIYSIIRS
jgi:NitT/TauT family transport system ATP-binding protein